MQKNISFSFYPWSDPPHGHNLPITTTSARKRGRDVSTDSFRRRRRYFCFVPSKNSTALVSAAGACHNPLRKDQSVGDVEMLRPRGLRQCSRAIGSGRVPSDPCEPDEKAARIKHRRKSTPFPIPVQCPHSKLCQILKQLNKSFPTAIETASPI